MKRCRKLVPVLALGIALSAGPAWADSDSGGATESAVVANDGSVGSNPLGGTLADARRVLTTVEAPSPLRSLLTVFAGQLESLESQLAQLYEELFVGTCPTCDET